MSQDPIRGNNYETLVEDGYIYQRVWGTLAHEEAEKSAQSVMDLAHDSGSRIFVLDVRDLEWINDMHIRARGLELMSLARSLFDQTAIIAKRPVSYLVTTLARGGGMKNVKSFDTKEEAVAWVKGEV